MKSVAVLFILLFGAASQSAVGKTLEEVTPKTVKKKNFAYRIDPLVVSSHGYVEAMTRGDLIGVEIVSDGDDVAINADSAEINPPFSNLSDFHKYELSATEANIAILKNSPQRFFEKAANSAVTEPLSPPADAGTEAIIRFNSLRECIKKALPRLKRYMGQAKLTGRSDPDQFAVEINETTGQLYSKLQAGEVLCSHLLPKPLKIAGKIIAEKRFTEEAIVLTTLAKFTTPFSPKFKAALTALYALYGEKKLSLTLAFWSTYWKKFSLRMIFNSEFAAPSVLEFASTSRSPLKRQIMEAETLAIEHEYQRSP